MSKKCNSKIILRQESGEIPKEARIHCVKIFVPEDKIYEEYINKIDELVSFEKSVKSHLQFLQKLCRAGLKEGDTQRLNGVINFCESFLIRNHLKDTTDQGGTDETID